MRAAAASFLCLLVCVGTAFAAPHFPALTGRVVDDAHILPPATEQSLTEELAAQETSTTNQVVVATIASLDGETIENYGYQLGRYWGIGQKGKDNGLLLIIAPNDHKVRIEVGYGLEPVITDAISSEIIQGIILPDFRAGNMEKGVVDGTHAVLSILSGKSLSEFPGYAAHPESVTVQLSDGQALLMLLGFIFFLWFCSRHPLLAMFLLSNNRYGSSRMDSGWSEGFSGGGGSFGGGGSSGSW